jgi:HSP20 family molecular chaperone IbpA
MAIVQSLEKSQVMEDNPDQPRYKVTPRYGAWLRDDKFVLEIALPGVAKDAIKIKAMEDYFTLRAERENIIYSLDLDLNFKIEPTKVTNSYEEGLLRVEFERYNPLEKAVTVFKRDKTYDDATFSQVYPNMYRDTHYEAKKVTIEISLPGVKQEDIELKVLPTWFHLSAIRPHGKVEYAADVSFGVDIVPEKTTAEYYHGLLKIHAVIHDPMDDAKEIAL